MNSTLLKYGLAVLLAIGALYAIYHSGYKAGEYYVQKVWDDEKVKTQAALDKAVADLKLAQAATNTKVEVKYVDRIKIVKVKGDTIETLIPQIITVKDDAACQLPTNYEWLLNTAAAPSNDTTLPSTPSSTDGATTPITLSEASKSVVENYTICNQNAEQLKSLQDWVKLQK
jgi:uncharacterized protein YxeA